MSPRAGGRARRTRPTRAAAGAVAAGAVLLVLSGSTRNGWLVLLAGFAFGVPAAALALRPRVGDLGVVLAGPRSTTAGATVVVDVVVTNTGPRACAPATATLSAPGLRATEVAVPALRPGASARAAVPVEAPARTAVDTVVVTVRSTAPLGVLAVRATDRAGLPLLVRPRPGPALTVAPGAAGAGGVPSTAAGPHVHGVREWRPGEATARVHARATARHGRPVVLDRYAEPAPGLGLVVGGQADDPLFELAVSTVASTAAGAADHGLPVAAAAGGEGPAALRDATAEDVLDWCARLTRPSAPDPALVRAVADAVGPRGTVVVADTGWSAAALWWTACLEAARAADATLLVLHASRDGRDSLCLHAPGAPRCDPVAGGRL